LAPAPRSKRYAFGLSLAALGVVFGDIGTSPLYAVRESFSGHFGVAPSAANVLGTLSLIFWSLVVIVSLKYVLLVMRADNDGEGGVLALTALIKPVAGEAGRGRAARAHLRSTLVIVGLFGAALLFGDAILTPAISVLGGMEGLAVAAPGLEPLVVPISVGVLAGLFLLQKRGSGGVGRLFGPIMVVWFAVLSLLGIQGILRAPQILEALNPLHAVAFLAANGPRGLLALGAIFLVVTGAEALYADMGHFGRIPIRNIWFLLVFPALFLSYFGQGALVLADPSAVRSPFYLLAPDWGVIPLTVLATAAAVIASQAVISGVFSLALQIVQLGYWPRLDIRHTSAREYGQIFVPKLNAALGVATVLVVLAFRSSGALAAAYGVAIVCTMIVTTALLFVVAPERWRWPRAVTWLVLGGFLVVESAFLAANVLKIHEGGWLPLAVAGGLLAMALSWRRGREFIATRLKSRLRPVEEFLAALDDKTAVRVPGNAVYMTGDNRLTPTQLLKNVEHQKALHEKVVLLTVVTESVAHVRGDSRMDIEVMEKGFVRVTVRYGFMDTPDILAALDDMAAQGLPLEIPQTTFFLGRERLITTKRPLVDQAWVALYSFLDRNSQRAWAFYRLPPERVVEIGSHIDV